MLNQFDLVVFDWEGTIADTLGAVLHLVAEEAKLLGFGSLNEVEAKKYVGLGLTKALKKAYPNLSSKEHDQLLQAVHLALHTRSTELYLIPGVEQFIHQLQDAKINMAIATNKGQHSLARALEVTGLNQLIKVTRSAGQVAAKPNPQMLKEIMAVFQAHSSTTLMIGDSITDIEMAKNVQVKAIGLDVYHQQGNALKMAGAEAVFDDYGALARYLNLKG